MATHQPERKFWCKASGLVTYSVLASMYFFIRDENEPEGPGLALRYFREVTFASKLSGLLPYTAYW